jgi:hypothetical protein
MDSRWDPDRQQDRLVDWRHVTSGMMCHQARTDEGIADWEDLIRAAVN